MNGNHRRASLFGQASDALAGFRFGRRRPSVRLRPEPLLAIPHVIDISAPAPDEELEERQRLRDAAAHSIGLLPLIEDTKPHEEDEPDEPQQETVVLPPFPASYSATAPLAALSAALPKYYPPNSLRIFALSKQWKHRHIILSVPAGRVSHLHLFKGTHAEDRELERLEINADSVVFVAEGTFDLVHIVKVGGADVGAHRRDWNPTDDAARTVWLLHLPTSADAQQWISRIKAAIFEQRTHRAGLPPTSANATGPEPRGDMDVMLSMRLAASPPSSVVPPAPSSTSPSSAKQPPTPTSPSGNYAASLAPSASERSVRSVATAPARSTRTRPPSSSGPKGAGTAAVAALKGLFSHGRPRSTSAASVISGSSSFLDAASSTRTATPPPTGDSFAHMGSLLARNSATSSSVAPVPLNGNGNVAGNRMSVLERRIIGNGERERVASESDVNPTLLHPVANGDSSDHAKRRTLSYGLQPPPRARMTPWAESGLDEGPSEDEAADGRPPLRMYTHPHASGSTGTAGSFGVRSPSVTSVHEDGYPNGHTHLSADRVSERSVSTGRSRASSVGNGPTAARSNSGRGRRWSTLPRRLTPPESPPPAPPLGNGFIPHPYAAASSSHERTPSRASGHSFGSGKATGSGWTRAKRASGMSIQSVGGLSVTGTSASGGNSANASVGSLVIPSGGSGRVRTSMPPPPRPAPTTALPPAPSPGGSPNGRTSFRDSRSSTVSFWEPPPQIISSISLPVPPPPPTLASKPAPANGKSSSFRESTQRALRLSLLTPRPPPLSVLPPRPDEPQEPPAATHKVLHRRSNSASATGGGSIRNSLLGNRSKNDLGLHAIPASPPPRGPLPPTPVPSADLPRTASLRLKQRLRILSAPPAPHPQQSAGEQIAAPIARPAGAMTLASFLSISASTPTTPVTSTPVPLPTNGLSHGTPPAPGTPIGEKIMQWNDASFLQMSAASTPVLRPLPVPSAIESESYHDHDYPEVQMVSLLPPPRRGSRQISLKEIEPRTPTPEYEQEAALPRDLEAEGAGPGPGKLFSLSRHGSVISLLGLV
ncbi:hypothetical protein C8F01DRAFT_1151207 [Mycena amicta]|nr:hypothetical protein C8F01DRAFT_1151207 [Mycena amicta]